MDNESKSRECPYCKEDIKSKATKCKHCGSAITPERPFHEGTCPYCKEQIQPEAIRFRDLPKDRIPVILEDKQWRRSALRPCPVG
jgi:predicted amidophosphoribosyltransferase